jgi:3-oxoacyl-[acyl-carrier protein] reductase
VCCPVPYAPTPWPPRGVGQVDRIAATIPMGRIGEPADIADIADIVGFLVSEEARWITGASLPTSDGAF